MDIQEGHTYVLKSGDVVGPLRRLSHSKSAEWEAGEGVTSSLWTTAYLATHAVRDVPPSPVRTVTRKEIVPGKFGVIEIENDSSRVTEDGVSLWLPRNHRYSPAELRATAATLIEIADALETP